MDKKLLTWQILNYLRMKLWLNSHAWKTQVEKSNFNLTFYLSRVIVTLAIVVKYITLKILIMKNL